MSSPPYNLGKEYEARQALDLYLSEQEHVLRECHRVLKMSGSLFWQVGAFSEQGQLIPLDIKFFPILEKLGMQPRNRIVWIRQHGLHARNKFSARHETLLWFTKSNDYKFSLERIRVPQKYQNKKYHKGDKRGQFSCNPSGKNPGDIWAFRNVKHNHEEQTIHPCQFPEDLIARVVLSTTVENDVVYDPYMGTGTVAVVARDEGRQYLGAEIDDRYYEVCQRRISGRPNDCGVFANLKCLREYCYKTGEPVAKYRFDVQTSNIPTELGKSRIHPEEHHLQELDRRLEFEEASFGARRRNHDAPDDYFTGGKVPAAEKNQMHLFDTVD
ncbi:MAG: site-specific DNA-methyltransferase [Kiritimatiellia bacterium]